MILPRSVYLDLIPLYLAGELSDDTRALLEEHFQTDPEMARLVEIARTASLAPPRTASLNPDVELKTFRKAKRLMFQHNLYLLVAVLFTFLFAMSIPFLWDDHRSATPVFFVVACFFWFNFYRINRQLNE